MSGSSFVEAFFRLHNVARKADVRHPMRVSITFGDDSDKYRFIYEIKRELEPHLIEHKGLLDCDELTVCGVRVRLL